jgi:predicted regulator of Ras-like GTPase activity (Roadblock/LC7/MglB family)
MNAQQALADLTEISSQIQAAVVFDDKGKVAGSTLDDAERGDRLARSAQELLAAAESIRGESTLTQLEVATSEGSVFVVREGSTCIAATTGSNPTAGLVFYDLKSALRSAKPARAARKRAATGKKTPSAGAAKKKTASRKTSTRRKPDET